MNLYTIKELSQIVKYSTHSIYRFKKSMTPGEHYFQVPHGKILFSDKAIDFFLNRIKGKNENIERKCVQKERKPVSVHQHFHQQKKAFN